MRKKPEYGLAFGMQAACCGDEWQVGVLGWQHPYCFFRYTVPAVLAQVKNTPEFAPGYLHL